MQSSEELNELFKALNKFRSQLKQPSKDAKNPFFKSNYVTLEGVQNAIDKAIEGTGLAYTQLVSNTQSGVAVQTILTHESGQWLSSERLELTPTKKDPQGYGSAISYQKRYQLASMFGVSSDIDDDGNAGSFVATSKPQTKMQPKPQPKKQDSALNKAKAEYQELIEKACDATGRKVADIQQELVKETASISDFLARYEKMNSMLKDMLKGETQQQTLGGITDE